MRSCKEISVLLSEAHERKLGLAEQLGLRLHLLLCDGCRNFRRQLAFIRAAARRYPDRDDAH
jgi:hypothetical protein